MLLDVRLPLLWTRGAALLIAFVLVYYCMCVCVCIHERVCVCVCVCASFVVSLLPQPTLSLCIDDLQY